jgi:hypothetical protein
VAEVGRSDSGLLWLDRVADSATLPARVRDAIRVYLDDPTVSRWLWDAVDNGRAIR